ncbi:unnamed protein product [Lathyrus oleraceus]
MVTLNVIHTSLTTTGLSNIERLFSKVMLGLSKNCDFILSGAFELPPWKDKGISPSNPFHSSFFGSTEIEQMSAPSADHGIFVNL